MSEGIVYVLTNPAMPGMVKIGKTGREVEARLNDLYTTGVPLPFECAYAARVADMDKVKKPSTTRSAPTESTQGGSFSASSLSKQSDCWI